MTMGAKRFGVGILVGLVLALAIIASAGFSYGTFGSFSANNIQLPVKSQATSTTTAASTMSTTTGTSNGSSSLPVVIVTNSTKTGTEYGPSSNVQNSAPLDALYSSLTNGTTAGVQASPNNALTSRPASVAWVVFIPIVVALVLGLVLYRSSAGKLAKD